MKGRGDETRLEMNERNIGVLESGAFSFRFFEHLPSYPLRIRFWIYPEIDRYHALPNFLAGAVKLPQSLTVMLGVERKRPAGQAVGTLFGLGSHVRFANSARIVSLILWAFWPFLTLIVAAYDITSR